MLKVLILLLAIFAALAIPGAALNVSVSAPGVMWVGQDYDIRIDAGPGPLLLGGYQTTILYDPALFMPVKVREGSLLGMAGSPTLFSQGAPGYGKVSNILGAILGNSSVTGPGTFAIVTLRPLASGNATISLQDTKVSAANGTGIPVQQVNRTVEVREYEKYDLNRDGDIDILDVVLVVQAVQ